MTLYVAHDGRRYACYTVARDGRTRIPVGCSHETPRQAIRHQAPVYAAPTSRRGQDPNGTDSPPNRGVRGTPPALLGSPDALPSRTLGL